MNPTPDQIARLVALAEAVNAIETLPMGRGYSGSHTGTCKRYAAALVAELKAAPAPMLYTMELDLDAMERLEVDTPTAIRAALKDHTGKDGGIFAAGPVMVKGERVGLHGYAAAAGLHTRKPLLTPPR